VILVWRKESINRTVSVLQYWLAFQRCTIVRAEADDRYTHATTVGVSNYDDDDADNDAERSWFCLRSMIFVVLCLGAAANAS